MGTEYETNHTGILQHIFQKVNTWAFNTASQMHKNPSDTSTENESSQSNRNLEIYNEKTSRFCQIFLTWEKDRLHTIESLKQLLKSLQRFQSICNKTNIFIKELNVNSRQLKTSQNSIPVDLLASMATLVTDAASGFTSVAQAYNVDGYLDAYRSIVEKDIELTRPLYQARSQCLHQYEDIEEVPRNVQSSTLMCTMDDITKSLKLDEFMGDISTATEASNVYQSVDKVIKKNLGDSEVMDKVSNSLNTYIHRNPAFLQALESAGKTIFDAVDVFSVGSHKSVKTLNANAFLIGREKEEIGRLKAVVSCENVEEDLELDISNTIDFMEKELSEIRDNFKTICMKDERDIL